MGSSTSLWGWTGRACCDAQSQRTARPVPAPTGVARSHLLGAGRRRPRAGPTVRRAAQEAFADQAPDEHEPPRLVQRPGQVGRAERAGGLDRRAQGARREGGQPDLLALEDQDGGVAVLLAQRQDGRAALDAVAGLQPGGRAGLAELAVEDRAAAEDE